MKVLELFAGTCSFSKVAKSMGYDVYTIDNDNQHDVDMIADILNMKINDLPKKWRNPDIIWASPPCKTFSVASISTHWTGGKRKYFPKTIECEMGLKLLEKSIMLIKEMKPKYWIIENPVGVMRKLINEIFWNYEVYKVIRSTVTYCQYGDIRMKPTDLWHNIDEWKPRKKCKKGDPCHESSPRGSKSGTQGIKSTVVKSIVPEELCREILESIT